MCVCVCVQSECLPVRRLPKEGGVIISKIFGSRWIMHTRGSVIIKNADASRNSWHSHGM